MNHGQTASAERLLYTVRDALQRHPRRVLASVGAALLMAGGYATASLAPDAADLPVRQVVEVVQPLPLLPQIELLDEHLLRLHRSDVSRSSDTADTLLSRLGVSDPAAAAFLRANPLVRQSLLGRAGRNVSAEADDQQLLQRLVARWVADESGNFKRLVVERKAAGFESRVEIAPLTASVRLASGTIRSSLFAATDDARVPDAVAVQIAEIFSGDIDFHRALRKGDRFSVAYETLEGDGEPLRSGRVLSTEFVNGNRKFQAVWFEGAPAAAGTGERAKGAYYTPDGQSLRKAFLTSPLEFSRVTSGFKMRMHPILRQWRAHLGVDYAAPTGTPVRTVADGVVEFAGVQGGFGNVVFVKHANNQTTVYAHLSRIDVRKGQAVSQAQVIGAVGATGWATGPHLHFEFRVNGVHQDPMTIARQAESGAPVAQDARPAFDRVASEARLQFAAAATLRAVEAQ